MIYFWLERPYSSGATEADGSVCLEAIAVLVLTVATPGEAVEGSRRACCFGGGVDSAKTFTASGANVFSGTGSSKADGLRGGVATLPLAAAVDVFASTFAFFEAADFLVLLIGRSKNC